MSIINKEIINDADKQYFDLCKRILNDGVVKSDRTGTGTISVFDHTMRFKMSDGLPILTSKKVFTRGVIHELIWFLRGDTNIRYLLDNNIHIWDGDCYKNYINNSGKMSEDDFISMLKTDDDFCKKWGDMGPIYGHQWRDWGGYKEVHITDQRDDRGFLKFNEVSIKGLDQIKSLIEDLKNNPDSRRLIVSAWRVEDLPKMKLPPCHFVFQCYTQEIDIEERRLIWSKQYYNDDCHGIHLTNEHLDEIGFPKRKMSLKWTQRSVDTALGLPFNVLSYSILLHLLCKEVNMIPNELIFSGGDCHIYSNHIDGIKEQMDRDTFNLPTLKLNNSSIFDLKFEDIHIINYKSSPSLEFELSN